MTLIIPGINPGFTSILIPGMVLYDVLIKRKTSLDQLRQGLSILNFKKAIESHPNSMVKYLLNNQNTTAEQVISKIEYTNGEEHEKNQLNEVLTSLNQAQLLKFLEHTTGTPSLWALKPGSH